MSALFIGGLNLTKFILCSVLWVYNLPMSLSQEDYLKLSATKTVWRATDSLLLCIWLCCTGHLMDASLAVLHSDCPSSSTVAIKSLGWMNTTWYHLYSWIRAVVWTNLSTSRLRFPLQWEQDSASQLYTVIMIEMCLLMLMNLRTVASWDRWPSSVLVLEDTKEREKHIKGIFQSTKSKKWLNVKRTPCFYNK